MAIRGVVLEHDGPRGTARRHQGLDFTSGMSDVLRSVNGTASKCKTFLATATEECCPAIGTLAGHFTRRLSPSPMPGKRIQQQRAYLPLKRSSRARNSIVVDSVAATLEEVVANGGEIAQPIGADAPEITARFRAPSGNVLGLYQEPARSGS